MTKSNNDYLISPWGEIFILNIRSLTFERY